MGAVIVMRCEWFRVADRLQDEMADTVRPCGKCARCGQWVKWMRHGGVDAETRAYCMSLLGQEVRDESEAG